MGGGGIEFIQMPINLKCAGGVYIYIIYYIL